ncbi:flavoprotein [Pseudonocardia lacus]|uniref:flavoprotein n=1 Tax=Pseudonocardia lacus TaxID=2835865 RepID=UPI001BDCBD23|nr:flavoprotein [Pseudonocardia lacus]
MTNAATDVLTLVVCGAPLAARASDVAAALGAIGWTVTVVASPASQGWLDVDAIQVVTGRPVLFEQRDAHQASGPRPAAVVACPLTMNTASKAGTAIMDTYAAGVLVDALAVGTPLTLVLMVSDRLWRHPAWLGHLATLGKAGARFVSPTTGLVSEPEPVRSGTGPEVVAGFDPAALARTVGAPRRS